KSVQNGLTSNETQFSLIFVPISKVLIPQYVQEKYSSIINLTEGNLILSDEDTTEEQNIFVTR
ncbi:21749_t:CDS:1, partial [Gigaspora rosea]